MYYLRSHARIVSAFIAREVATRYSGPGGYLWAFIEPIAFIAMMSMLIGSLAHIPPIGDSFVVFYATGYLAFSLFKSMEGYVTSSINANTSLMSYPVVAPIDAVVARLILQGITSIIVTVIVLTGALYTARRVHPLDWLSIFEAVSFGWTLALGVAMANMVIFKISPLYEKVYQILSRPLFLLSGVFYIPAMMPHPYRDILLYNPIVHIIMLFRQGFYGPAAADGVDKLYLMEWAGGALLIGMTFFTLVDVAKSRR